MATTTSRSTNGTESNHKGTVKRRMTWREVTYFPDNPIYPRRVEAMRANGRSGSGYNDDIVGSPEVFDNSELAFPEYPSETLFVGEGNHRRKLAEEEGVLGAEFLANLHRGLTRAEMHKRRRGFNDKRTVKPAETFLHLAEENRLGQEAQVKDVVEGLGWSISHTGGDHVLFCTNELMWIWNKSRGAVTGAIMSYEEAFGTAWKKGDTNAQARIIKGLGAFWIRYPDADMDRLVKSLKRDKQTPNKVYSAARNQKETLSFISNIADGVRYVLAQVYNKHQRAGKLAL